MKILTITSNLILTLINNINDTKVFDRLRLRECLGDKTLLSESSPDSIYNIVEAEIINPLTSRYMSR